MEGAQVSSLFECDFYSVRIRDLWQIACIKKDLAGFSDFEEERVNWQRTYPGMQQHLQMMSIIMERQLRLLRASITNTGVKSIVAAYTPVEMYGHYGKFSTRCSYDTTAAAQDVVQFNWGPSRNGASAGPMMSVTELEGLGSRSSTGCRLRRGPEG